MEFYAAKINEFVMDRIYCFGTRTWTRPQTRYSELKFDSARVVVKLGHGVGVLRVEHCAGVGHRLGVGLKVELANSASEAELESEFDHGLDHGNGV